MYICKRIERDKEKEKDKEGERRTAMDYAVIARGSAEVANCLLKV